MKRRFEARRDRAVCPRSKIASMKGLTANQTSSSISPGIFIDTAREKRVTFKSSRREHGETSSHERDAPKTSEYAYFKRLKNNSGLHSHSLGKDKRSKDSEDMNNSEDLRFSNHAEKVRPINYSCPPPAPAVTKAMATEPTYARGNHHHSFHTPLVGEKQLLNCDLDPLPLHQKYKYSDADVFSKKRKKLCHLIAETSSREVKQLSLKGQDLVTALLSRLFPEGNENNVPCRTEKPKVTKSDICPKPLTYYTSKEIGWDCQSDPMMEKDDLWLSLDKHPLECDSIRSRTKYLPKWGTISSDSQPKAISVDVASEFNHPYDASIPCVPAFDKSFYSLEYDSIRSRAKYLRKWDTISSDSQPKTLSVDVATEFNHPYDASIPGVSAFDKSYYGFDAGNYNLESEYKLYKPSSDEAGWGAAADYTPPLTSFWESFCNENKITRYADFGQRMASSFEKYTVETDPLQLVFTRPYTGNYEWFGEFGSTAYFKQPTEVLDRRALTVGRVSSLPLLGWDYDNSNNGNGSELMSFFPRLPASSTADCSIPTKWSVNDELHNQTFVYRYPLRFNTPCPSYYQMEDLQPQYPGRRDDHICVEEDEISDFDNLVAAGQNSSPGTFSSMVYSFLKTS